MNMTKRSGKAPCLQALEDAAVVGGFSALGGLIAGGYPPSVELAYGVSLAAALAGLLTYAKARKIETS